MSVQPPTRQVPTSSRGESLQEGAALDFDLGEYIHRLRRHWKLIALSLLVMTGYQTMRYYTTPKVYEARARIQIKRMNIGSLSGGVGLFMENWWNLEYYPTQYRLLESRGLAEEVVRSEKLQDEPGFNQVAVAKEGAVTAEDDQAAIGKIAQQLSGGLQVDPIAKTQLVDLVYRHSDPAFAQRIVNAFAREFIAMGVKQRTKTASSASVFLQDQIEKVKTEITQAQQRIQDFNRRENVVALDPESNVTRRSLAAVNSEYGDAKAQRIEKEARYRQLQATPKETLADSLSGGLASEMRGELLRMESDYESRLQTYKETWPEMVELKAGIEQRRRELDKLINEQAAQALQSAYADLETNRNRELQLQREIDRLTSTAIDEQSATAEYSNLQTELANNQKLLDQLLRQQSETSVSFSMQDTGNLNVEIVDHALLPQVPILPSLRRSLSMGLLTGLLFGALGVFLVEFLDRTIKTSEEAERLLRLPMLSIILDVSRGWGSTYGRFGRYGSYGQDAKKGRNWKDAQKLDAETAIELLPHTNPRLAISEAYRSLRTALLLSSAEALRVVTVTSAQTGEGKTTTAANLAVVMAQLGRRVLLLDADLRKPRLHRIFQVSNRLGLVNLLTATEGVGQEVYQQTAVPNLHLLTSGPIPPNPAELLASKRMAELIEYLKKTFDFVVVDTTPALAVTDATLVGAMCDGVLLCLRAGKVEREEAKACVARLRMAEVKILGLVLNRYRSAPGRYGSHYHAYEAYADSRPGSEVAPSADSAA